MEPEGKEAVQLEFGAPHQPSQEDPPETGMSDDILIVSIGGAVKDNFDELWEDDVTELPQVSYIADIGNKNLNEEEKKEDENVENPLESTSREKLIIARKKTAAPDNEKAVAFCSDDTPIKELLIEKVDSASKAEDDEKGGTGEITTGDIATSENNDEISLLSQAPSDDARSVEVLAVNTELPKGDIDDEERAFIDLSSISKEEMNEEEHAFIDLSALSKEEIDEDVHAFIDLSDSNLGEQEDDQQQGPSSKRTSMVQSIREKFERGSRDNFDANGVVSLSVDMEKFYVNQRAQIAAYQQKRNEALVYYHGNPKLEGSPPTISAGTDQSSMPASLASTRELFEGQYVGYVFVVHEKCGLLMLKTTTEEDKTKNRYSVPGGSLSESDFVTAEFVTTKCTHGHSRGRLLAASRLAATRELFTETGIDARGSLDRLVPAKLRRDTFRKHDDGSILRNQFKRQIYFFLILTNTDFQDGIACTFASPEKVAIGDGKSHFVFEKDPAAAFKMLANATNEFGVADVFALALGVGHPMYNDNVVGLQFQSLTKLATVGDTTDEWSLAFRGKQNSEHEQNDDTEDCKVGSIPEAKVVLTYIGDVWGCGKDQPSGELPSLLKILAARDFPSFGNTEVIRIQKELDDVRAWRRKYDGMRAQQRPHRITTNDTLQQLLVMKAVLCEHNQLYSCIQKLEHGRVAMFEGSGPVTELEINLAVSDIDSALSDLETRKRNRAFKPDAVATPNELAGARGIAGGDLYPHSQWEVLQDRPDCHLKNKIVLADQEEVEVVALVLKAHEGQSRTFDSHLCVLNNEKRSSLKLNTHLDSSKTHRVKFFLKQLSCVSITGGKSGITQGSGNILCCFPCC